MYVNQMKSDLISAVPICRKRIGGAWRYSPSVHCMRHIVFLYIVFLNCDYIL